MLPKKYLLLLLLSVAVLAGVVFFGVSKYSNRLTSNNPSGSKNGTKVSAAKGQLITGFPQNLKPDSTATITDSFLIPYGNFKQYSAVFQSDLTIAGVYQQYLDFAQKNGYTIINKGQDKNFAHIYGTNSQSDFNVAINSVNGKTQINIGYLSKTDK